MQAIVTKFLGPTDFRPSRIKASCAALSRIYPWEDGLDPWENHKWAAERLAKELGWMYKDDILIGGTLPKSSKYFAVFVFANMRQIAITYERENE